MAQRIMALQTRRARPTRARDPLDTHALAQLDDGAFSAGAHLRDDAHAFVAAYLTGLRWCGESGPLSSVTRIKSGIEKSRKEQNMEGITEFFMTLKSLWQTPEWVLWDMMSKVRNS